MSEEMKSNTVKVELPDTLTDDISEKIAQAVKENYYFSAGRAIADSVKGKLEEDGFTDRVADAVVARMKLDEDEYTEGITNALKETLLATVGSLANAALEAVQKKIESYGFIQIGN